MNLTENIFQEPFEFGDSYYYVMGNPVRILNICYTIRHLGSVDPIPQIAWESVLEAERVYSRYNMVNFVKNWINDRSCNRNIPQEYRDFHALNSGGRSY